MVGEIQAILYRAVREFLINVAKHARVSDEGCGFDPTGYHCGVPGHGMFGLNSIHEHVNNIGGTMEIESSLGNGTTVTLTLPCTIAAKENQP